MLPTVVELLWLSLFWRATEVPRKIQWWADTLRGLGEREREGGEWGGSALRSPPLPSLVCPAAKGVLSGVCETHQHTRAHLYAHA